MNKKFVLENGLYLSFAAALVAAAGSLYLSEIMQFEPCKLCWFQRIFMYPLTILLGIAAVRKDYGIWRYGLPLSIIGGCISIYHYAIQKVPYFHDNATACGRVPCEYDYLDWWGVVTIPLLALIAFIIITVLLFMVRRASR
ncbi:disulfide oxidoreductase [Paenibacillus aurantius]|uniref:Disulfide oxidoreductase n=1 Tax=Paenibacillus aurantius TaxID=2918900 RepID=A0AA96LDS1_9BACL|nr:disulfide oxidoreductase [Paenibacillus aurantius]WNQ09812.1 disulfide oxidoreductase [Paenibacillus aurantius]